MAPLPSRCPVCSVTIHIQSLYRHLARAHNYTKEQQERLKEERHLASSVSQIACPICAQHQTSHETLANHCAEKHSEDGADGRPQNYAVFERSFVNTQDYERWLAEECKKQCTSLVIIRTRRKKNGTEQRYLGWLLAQCNRTGRYTGKATQRIGISKKDAQNCPCFLNVESRTGGAVMVKGCFGHAGHSLEPALLRLSTEQREILKQLLEGHTVSYVLRKLRSDFGSESRLFFITRKDLNNVMEKFNMRPGHRHSDDLTSLSLRFEDNSPEDGIRLYEPPKDPSGKGFLMVIITPIQVEWLRRYSREAVSIDDTHHTSRYHTKLASLMVADEKGRGLPAGFLLSGTMTSADVAKFFEIVRKLVPEFQPRTIVTDEAVCFYNGFRAIFPEAATQLHYCRFHILQTWKRHTRKLVDASLRPSVDNALGDLLKERHLEKFQERFGTILAFLRSKKQTAMSDYLTKNYLGKTPTWASFANKNAVMDTTMLGERWHKTIKDEILQRNANARLDFLVDMLIKAVEDKSTSIEIMDRRRFVQSSYRVRETHVRHRKAQNYYSHRPQKLRFAGNHTWKVESSKVGEFYTVKYRNQCTCNLSSNVHCLLCDVCPYAWECSCLDNCSGISCLHTHAVKLFGAYRDQTVPSLTAPGMEDFVLPTDVARTVSEVSSDEDTEEAGITDAEEMTSTQKGHQERLELLNEIEGKWAHVHMRALVLAKQDDHESLTALKKILDCLRIAADASPTDAGTSAMATRPALARLGRKPQLEKILLFPRAKMKTPRPRPPDLYESVRQATSKPKQGAGHDNHNDDSVDDSPTIASPRRTSQES